MARNSEQELASRVLLNAPTRRDGEVAHALLSKAGMTCVICPSLSVLNNEVRAGAGAVVLTEEAIHADGIQELLETLEWQPAWSDLPIVMMMRGGGQSQKASDVLRSLRNVTLLERPTSTRTLISATQAAIRARQRQYQTRDQMESVQRAESHVRLLQEYLENAVEGSQLGTFHVKMPEGATVCSDRCKAHFWLEPGAELPLTRFYSILHPDDRERVRRAVESSMGGTRPYNVEYRTVSPAGAVRWIRGSGRTHFAADGKPITFDGTTQDITQQKLSEAKLRETQDRFQAMANSIPQLAWMARPDGWIFWYNERWHQYCGSTHDQMQGWGWISVHSPDHLDRVTKKWEAALATGDDWEDTFPLRRYDGEYRWHLSGAIPFRDVDGKVILWFGTHTDITEERQRAVERQQLLESEQAARRDAERASRMKDEFLATLSHELRTPLNAIFGWTQLLRMRTPDAATLTEAIAVIDRNVRVQTQLIEDLLDMSRIISGKLRLEVQLVQVHEVINAAIEVTRAAIQDKGIVLEIEIASEIGAVSGDSGRLQQVFWNLLTNAMKFTPTGGTIRVVARQIQNRVEVRVTDTGEGIDPGFLPHLFERFSQSDGSITRQHGGLGLGLSIVRSLIELHGGTIRAESKGLGQGAMFIVTLPVSAAQAIADGDLSQDDDTSSPLPIPQIHKLRGVKVLVIDDDLDAREVVKRFLVEREAVPALASSAIEAWGLLKSFQPDVILSDIGMAGQDGYEFMRNTRRNGVQTPAIALTAFAREEDRVRSMQAGYQAHFAKPVEPARLLAMIASLTEN